jgi:hypothetical protein
MRFDGEDLITRGFAGDLARWQIPPVPSTLEPLRSIDRVLGCLPVRFDRATGGLTDQIAQCEFP